MLLLCVGDPVAISDILIRLQVSGVAFDSYWSAPNADGTGENIVYRFGSVGQVS